MLPWQSREFDEHEQVCAFNDPATGLRTIIAIHSTKLGTAIGGTRFLSYLSDDLALDDALRLSRAMSYKCALAGVPFGGGKAVIIGDPVQCKSPELLRSYGQCLNRIGSTFATGEDVGFSVADCEVIRKVSPYVAGTESEGVGDPSAYTALGVMHGLRALMRTKFDHEEFWKVKVAVQGLGNVGWKLCSLLHQAGTQLTVADIRADRVERAQRQFEARAVATDEVHAADVDIFSPCALSGAINSATVSSIRASVIGGAANNQFSEPGMSNVLHDRGVLYAPDYIINAGGVIGSVDEIAKIPGRAKLDLQPVTERLASIYDRLLRVFDISMTEGIPPDGVALRMARQLIGR